MSTSSSNVNSSRGRGNDQQYQHLTDVAVMDPDQQNLVADNITFANRQEYKRAKLLITILGISVIGLVAVVIGLSVDVSQLQKQINGGGGSGGSINPPASKAEYYQQLYSNLTSCMDTTVDPCDDFYQYACGEWIRSHPLPGDKVSMSRSFTTIADQNQLVLKSVAEADWPLLGPFYASCMDVGRLNERSASPIAPYLQQIDETMSFNELLTVVGKLQRSVGLGGVLFSVGVSPDSLDPTKNLVQLAQGGLSLRSRSYYVDTEHNLKSQLTTHISNMLKLVDSSISSDSADATAASIVDFENKIAVFTQTPDQLRDPNLVYNPIDLVGLGQLAPDFDWQSYFQAIAVPNLSSFAGNVETTKFFEHLNDLVNQTPLDTLKAYVRWHLIHSAADDLSDALSDESFHFYGKVVSGQQQKTVRWKKCVNSADGNMPELIGRYYVLAAFAGSSKNISLELINDIKTSFHDRLPALEWMDEATRDKAREKLSKFIDQIGYPDHWQSYASVEGEVKADTFYENLSALNTLNWDLVMDRLTKPVDKTIWQMSPPTVNAYYDPGLNSINFPAGILQPPFFSADFPSASLFGGISMVIGHELSHGFDDQGRQYDGDGKLINWWSDATAAAFKEKAECLVNQYSQETIASGEHVNGNLTLGENIADNGGIRTAYEAWQLWTEKHGEDEQIDDALSNDQLFFLSYATDWCQVISPEYAHLLVQVDPHSPARSRVNVPLRNFDKFAEAYSCKAGSGMSPAQRCTIW